MFMLRDPESINHPFNLKQLTYIDYVSPLGANQRYHRHLFVIFLLLLLLFLDPLCMPSIELTVYLGRSFKPLLTRRGKMSFHFSQSFVSHDNYPDSHLLQMI